MVERLRISWVQSISRIIRLEVLLVVCICVLVRWCRISLFRLMKQSMLKKLLEIIVISCLFLVLIRWWQIEVGVSRLMKWLVRMNSMLMWNRLLYICMFFLLSIWLELVFQVYCERLKCVQLLIRQISSVIQGQILKNRRLVDMFRFFCGLFDIVFVVLVG